MTEFHTEIRERAAETLKSLREARASGDDYLVEVREGELESLARLATEHDLTVPELRDYTAA